MLPSGQSLNKPAAVAVVCLRYLDICVGHILDHARAYFVEDFWTCWIELAIYNCWWLGGKCHEFNPQSSISAFSFSLSENLKSKFLFSKFRNLLPLGFSYQQWFWKFYACYLVFYNLMLLFYSLTGANHHYDICFIFFTFDVGLDLNKRGCTFNILTRKFRHHYQNLVSIVFPFQAYQTMKRKGCVNWDLVHKGGP